ncbi:hypothetical protein [Tateyamaria omphalii]|uniref:Uncharacterized protein n=1 Tax=Tateyamaria omphalii TaxID=299262 RepID=A0A1P8MVP0_9RHOB|nr:hypothetical protein [Tateyamaria omphalii]APX12160.1 hypothetical protein BWR18_11070 [Tateyamaria omphalii]
METFLSQMWIRCRDVAAALIASLWRGRATDDVVAWIEREPPGRQRGIVFGTLIALFLLSIGAAQFGLVGMCLFWGLVIYLIR